ncbi:sulfotransferase [Streptomyces sp. NPDC093089]|uniref:sulfotransferase n=1 Tax=Streptomyces sp. NPDC093089 TaxID=3366024 RepID=UPI003813A696
MAVSGIAGTPARDPLVRRIVGERVFGGRADDKGCVPAVYRRHVAEVVAAVPADRLLSFDPADGWGPLTQFLGAAEPLDDYPHVSQLPDFWRLCVRT